MSCGGQFCVYDATDVAAGLDGAGTDGGGGSDSGVVKDTTAANDSAAGDTNIADSNAADSNIADSNAVDGGVADTGDASKPDSQDAGGPAALSIAGLQQGTASLVCSNSEGQATTVAGVTLEVGIATAPIAPLGKLFVFYLRPEGASQVSGKSQGIKVVVFGDNPPNVKLGDRVRVTGDVVEFFCETEVTSSTEKVVILGSSALEPTPYLVKSADIAATSGASEPYEGVYVRLANVAVSAANVFGTDGKTHGTFAVAPFGAKGPEVHVAPTIGTSFTKKDETTGEVVTVFDGTESFSEIRGHLTYSFGTYQLRPTSDADLVK